MKTVLPAAIAFALAACSGEAGTENDAMTNDDMAVDVNAPDAMGADPATANLEIDSNPAAVDQAINATDNSSGLGNALDDAQNSVGNTM